MPAFLIPTILTSARPASLRAAGILFLAFKSDLSKEPLITLALVLSLLPFASLEFDPDIIIEITEPACGFKT